MLTSRTTTNRACPESEWILLTNPVWTWPASGGLGFPETWTAINGLAVIGQIDQGGIHLQTAQVTDASPPLLMPDLWRHAHFLQEEIDTQEATVSGWLADPNKNGRPNVLEYAFGTHPRLAQLAKAPAHDFIELTGSSYQTLRATIDPNIALTLRAEVSTDLINWFDSPADVTLHSQAKTELVFRDLTPVSPAAPCRAIRLRAELP